MTKAISAIAGRRRPRHVLSKAAVALAALLLAAPAAAQETQIRGFTDVVAAAGQRDSTTGFRLGQFDLFITSKLADHISFLGETVFEYDDDFVVDVERVIVAFTPKPYFKIAMGKHHTPIGYWNNAYHHGAMLQPTIHRPEMFRFEDEGGVLPIHTVGLLVSGRDISAAHLGYDLMVGNGSGSTTKGDNDRAKSYTAAVHAQVTTDFLVGASVYSDDIAPGTARPGGGQLTQPVRQEMGGAHIVYDGAHGELRAEWQHIRVHTPGTTPNDADAGYAYAGVRLGNFVPYGRYDVIDLRDGNPWLAVPSMHGGLLGLRYDVATSVVVKGEYGVRRAGGATARTLELQVAIGF
jgi:hypothetical protein